GYGPPPWAHGPGRPTGYAYYPGIYAPAPFVYYGTTYIPLRDASDVIGAALLWDSLRNRAVITYNGREFALIVGSPYAYYGGQMIALPAPPVVVGGYVYVPRDFFDRHLKVPVERDGGVLKLKGKTGWHEFNVAAAPPGYVYGAPERERERDREQARPGVGLPTQRGPEPARSQGSWMQQRDAENRSPAAKSSPAKQSGAKQSAGKSKQPQSKQGGKQGKQGGGWFKAKDQADKDD
ncbi:MAG TPA: copper amine oxidase N-terminal domain-containing protein, partial [Armatimonadota bacterium]|nr:copper amine oxidase N-terminal domain-containing protein [Armatimonadota bacterium]